MKLYPSKTSEEDLSKVVDVLKQSAEYAKTLTDEQRKIYAEGVASGYQQGTYSTHLDPAAYLVYCKAIQCEESDKGMKELMDHVESVYGSKPEEWDSKKIYEWYYALHHKQQSVSKQPWWQFWRYL